MKKYFLFLLFMCVGATQAQQISPGKDVDAAPMIVAPTDTKQDENTIYNAAGVEVKPEFPGGFPAFYKLFWKFFKMPNEPDLKGRVFVSFVVEKDGMVTDIKILRDIGYGTGAETVRVMKMLPKWIPAKQNGKDVRCSFQLPIAIPYQPENPSGQKIQAIPDKKS